MSRVPDYAPDGLDHWLTCDAKYEPLLHCKASIVKQRHPSLITDYYTEQTFLATVSDRLQAANILACLKKDWETKHMYSWFMNTMTREEYDAWFRTPYLAYVGEQNRKKKPQQEPEPEPVQRNESRTGSASYDDTDWESYDRRMQNISEFGW